MSDDVNSDMLFTIVFGLGHVALRASYVYSARIKHTIFATEQKKTYFD